MSESKCPFPHSDVGSAANQKWWPNQLNLNILNENNPNNDPMDDDFDYAAEFASLDFDALKADLAALMPVKEAPDMSKMLVCPMPGALIQLHVEEGEEVKAGQPLAVIEAMKMENKDAKRGETE